MAKFGIKTSSPQETGVNPTPQTEGNGWFKKNQRSIIAVALIAVIAFVVRFVFVYSTSASSGFALSAGSEHLHNITQILGGTIPYGIDYSMNYPYGAVNTVPIVGDLFLSQFALIGKAAGMSNTVAASAVLAWSGVIFGVLSCIMMYFVGKEFFDSKKAGYLASLFLALCPIVISETVFSNGSTAALIEFLFLIAVLLIVKGVKLIGSSQTESATVKDLFMDNKKAITLYAGLAGVAVTLIALSWNGFRSIITVLIFIMAIQALIDRFRGKDVRIFVIFYSVPIILTMIISAVYYICGGLWDAVFSGVFLASIIALVACYAFAFVQKKPWALTIPVISLAILVLFVVLFFVSPSYFNVIVCGNSTYSSALASIIGPTGLSLSKMATGFGPATMWFAILMIGMLIWKFPKSVSSPLYIFTLVFMCFCTFYAFVNVFNATVFSLVFAFGFAYVITWIFDHVDFKTYFTSFKGSDFKSIWKKIVKPVPFVTIIAIALLICAPNAMYAIDAGIPSNNSSDYDGALGLGAVSYSVRDADTSKTTDVLSTYSGLPKSGALVTWFENADDAASYGGFSSIVDRDGNGVEAASNILLANGSDGSSTAAMLIYLMKYIGVDKCEALLVDHGLTGDQFDALKDALNNPGKYRSTVLSDTEKYGVLSTSISDTNVMYIYGKEFLTDCCSAYTISSMYEILEKNASKNISYFMISSDMFPMDYRYSSSFQAMALMNGYVADSDGTITNFEVINYYTYYTYIFGYTDAMYDTLLWRAYVGMSPAEAGFGSSISSSYEYFVALMLSDGSTKATPGFGLGNYQVDYDHLYVKYNAKSDATLSSDGWTKMLYWDAIEKQNADGGLINYLAGYPVVVKYVPNNAGTEVSGTVVDKDGQPVEGIRVTVTDSKDLVRSTDITNEYGKYTVFVTDSNSKIEVFAASTTLVDGELIKTYASNDVPNKIVIPETSITGTLVDSDGAAVATANVKMTLTGAVSGKTYVLSSADGTITSGMTFKTGSIVPDKYTISVTSADGKTEYVSTTYTTVIGENAGLNVKYSVYKITVTVNNEIGGQIEDGVIVNLTSADGAGTFSAAVESGKAAINAYAGTYTYSVNGAAVGKTYMTTADAITVSAATSKTIKVVEGNAVSVTGVPNGQVANVYGSSYMKSYVMSSDVNVIVPKGTADGAFFSVYSVDATKNVYWSTISGSSCSVTSEVGHKVSGKITLSTESVSSGSIRFIDQSNNREMTVAVDSDGLYSVILPTGTYTVYVVASSESLIDKLVVEDADIENKDYTTAVSANVTGYVYWTTTSYAISYAPIKVDSITGKDGYTLNFMTDVSGKYSIYVPKDASCNVTATLGSTTPYYFEIKDEVKQYVKTVTVNTADTTSESFKALIEKLTVQNDTAYDIKVGSGTTAITVTPGTTGQIAISSYTLPVEIDTTVGGVYYYYKDSVYVAPSMAVKSINVTPVEYCKATITGLETTDKVSVSSLDDDHSKTKDIETTGTERSWYLQKDGKFEFTLKNSDATKLMYKTVTMTDDVSFAAALKESFDVSGYVGISESGVLTVKYDGESHDFTINSSGRYSITLPLVSGATYGLQVEINKDSETLPHYYTATDVQFSASDVAAGQSYVYNAAVVGGEDVDTDDVKVNITTVTMDDVKVDAKKLINVSFAFNLERTATADATYMLSQGSDWNTLLFYSDEAMKSQITAVKMAESELVSKTIYAKGTVANGKAALNTATFSVEVTDINGEAVGSGMFTSETAGWVKTVASASTTVLEYGVDKVGDSEYNYSVKINNKDNFDKKFNVLLVTDLSSNWFITYVYDGVIYSSGNDITIHGYTEGTVYVKLTSKHSVNDLTLSEVKIKVTSGDGYEMSTVTEGISVADDKLSAEYTSLPMGSAVKITTTSAEGRGVINVKSDMPSYIWFIIALIIIALILLVWISIRRGVFTRKK